MATPPRRQASPRSVALWLLLVAGVAVAAYLVYVALSATAEPYCRGVGDCHTVQTSEYASIAGIPVAVLGLGMYLGLLALHVASSTARFRGVPILRVWFTVLAGSGMLYSAYLTYLELQVINAICIYCVVSASIVTLIAILSWPDFSAARRVLAAEM